MEVHVILVQGMILVPIVLMQAVLMDVSLIGAIAQASVRLVIRITVEIVVLFLHLMDARAITQIVLVSVKRQKIIQIVM